MKYAVAFLLFAGFFAYWGVRLCGWGYVLAWPALNSLLLSASYAGLGAKMLGKTQDGRIPIFFKVLYCPYFLYTYAMWHMYRLMAREEPVSHVADGILAGRRLVKGEVPRNVVNYVDLTAEMQDPREVRSLNYICLPILDASIPKAQELDAALARLREGSTFVHCAQGHGRTGIFVSALLVKKGLARSGREGLEKARSVRKSMRLNGCQTKFLDNYLPA